MSWWRERESQHEKSVLLERLIPASPAGIFIFDFEGRIESANAPAARPDFTQALDVSIARNTQLANLIANFAHLVRPPPPAPRPTDAPALLRSIACLLLP